MSSSHQVIRRLLWIVALAALVAVAPALAQGDTATRGVYQGLLEVVKFDVSPPLRSMTPLLPLPPAKEERDMEDDPEVPLGPYGPQDIDPIVQYWAGNLDAFTPPIVSFNGPTNLAGVSPPDPVGDVGPNHYVAMSNLFFAIYDKTGTLLFGPAANNTLWAGFGGPCQTENAGDPIVLYDQLADRWLLTQFSDSSGPPFYNCIALSQTGDPTGAYYRWQVDNGANFPDYPKYGIWPDAYYLSTRDFGASQVSVGAYAMNRAQMIAGNPAPQIVFFIVPVTPNQYPIGDGLLPSDFDGDSGHLPPAGAPNVYVGTQDNGGPYSAPSDALNLWEFHVDWVTPANSTFTLAHTLPTVAFDSIFDPCGGTRSCIPQPGTTNKLDILSYRQRPLHRAAYRNFGDHESIVTNQSVEAGSSMAGIRWWEIRDPAGTPTIFQEGTYAPGVSDGVHRWMGSAAMDSAGNMAIGFSASNGTTTFPSLWYAGRLAGDPAGTLPRGEGSIIDGTGSQTGSQRWGDYTSLNVDPIDDCTFWYVNEYLPTTSSVGWQLRIGAFKFDECGTPDYYLGATPASQEICAPANAVYTINVGSVASYTDPVTLSASSLPGSATAGFAPNPVTPPGSSTLTIGNTGTISPGLHTFSVDGASTSGAHSKSLDLTVYAAAPAAPTLTAPADGAVNVPVRPTFTWSAAAGASSYFLEVATDLGFSNVIYSATVAGTSHTPGSDLPSNTTLYWRVTAGNPCGPQVSGIFSFGTVALPGDCATGTTAHVIYSSYSFEPGTGGFTHSGTGDTWARVTTNPHSGTQNFLATDPAALSDQRLASPTIGLPTGENPVVVKFWHVANLEPNTPNCYDGGILEVSNNGGSTWTQVPAGSILTGGYQGAVSTCCSNPLQGLQAWCGTSTYTYSVADLTSYAGQSVQFRFRLGSDSSVSNPGWSVDDVVVQSCTVGTLTNLFSDGFESGNTSAWSQTTP